MCSRQDLVHGQCAASLHPGLVMQRLPFTAVRFARAFATKKKTPSITSMKARGIRLFDFLVAASGVVQPLCGCSRVAPTVIFSCSNLLSMLTPALTLVDAGPANHRQPWQPDGRSRCYDNDWRVPCRRSVWRVHGWVRPEWCGGGGGVCGEPPVISMTHSPFQPPAVSIPGP